ncbi:unnamed protein product [Caenorhabditis angaria]|uniref:Domain of unknown function WSN domain-containing protein n=1 Tax=Caenorhabditis angaria TaxID=860376 RepID=A0A9P1N6U4_9PELO|nr:unnamed protein product [Caenorhabditis angaria]
MLIILSSIFLVFTLDCVHSETIPISSSPLNATYELEKIAKSCLTNDEHDKLSGYKHKTKGFARLGNRALIQVTEQMIAISEMRKVLGMSSFTGKYRTATNEEIEIAKNLPEKLNASNFEKYFETVTNVDVGLIIDGFSVCQNEMITAIQFFDKNFPAIRQIFRLKLEEFSKKSSMNRNKKLIEDFFNEYHEILSEVGAAIDKMYDNSEGECGRHVLSLVDLARFWATFGKGIPCN